MAKTKRVKRGAIPGTISTGETTMAKAGKKSGGKKSSGKKLFGAAAKKHAARVARGGYKPKKKAPTAFQKFLMSNPEAAKKKMGWK